MVALLQRRGAGGSLCTTHSSANEFRNLAREHAYLSDILIDGRPGVTKDLKRRFELA
jgi:hypothetical protein